MIECCESLDNFKANIQEILEYVDKNQITKVDDSFKILKNIIKKRQPHERFYSLFLVKEIVNRLSSNPSVIESLGNILQQRLFVMGYVMKNKNDWRECGTILSKTAKPGEEGYLWGLRFYKLLLECFLMWGMMDASI